MSGGVEPGNINEGSTRKDDTRRGNESQFIFVVG